MHKLFLALGLAGILCAAEPGLPVNLLRNGSFDEGMTTQGLPLYWGTQPYNQAVISSPIAESFGKSLRISRTEPGYSIGAQFLNLNLPVEHQLVIVGYWRGQNIQGRGANWNGAKVQLIFYDAAQREIDQPYDAASQTGSFAWQMFIQNVVVPPKAVTAKVLIGLWDASGEVLYDDLQIYTVRRAPEMILQNGDFEIWGNWEIQGQGQIDIRNIASGHDNALFIANTEPEWTFGSQVIPVAAGKKYRLSGEVIYSEIVPGSQDWQKGRVYAEYLDEQMQPLQAAPDGLKYFDGSSRGWEEFQAEFSAPEGAKFAKLYFGLQDCTGGIVFDNLQVE
ncbi:MAG: hypothetical protein LBD99_01060 [Candidatus Margulisbacteria bacterium]|jgi:hypothetical protein|nr:hypothetical protein [Candidatus Margulisiibacteriota bacterium]